MKTYVLIFLTMVLYACHPAAVEKRLTAEATVLSAGIDNHVPMLIFNSSQKEIEQMVGASPNGFYYALSLDKSLRTVGAKLTVTVRKPSADELPAFTAMGPAYQAVTIVNANAK